MINYILTIKVKESLLTTSFNTEEISEEDFYSVK